PVMSLPLKTMRPWVGLRNLVSRLKQVVLPAPFGPISAWILPRSTRRLTSRTATKPANSLVRPSVSRTISSAIERANSPLARLLSQAFRQRSRGGSEVTCGCGSRRGSAWALQHDHGRGELQDQAKHERCEVTARSSANEADQTGTQGADHATDPARQAQHHAECRRLELAMDDERRARDEVADGGADEGAREYE